MIPTMDAPYDIISGPDGNIWYSDVSQTSLGRITPSGMITEIQAGMDTTAIAVGPDGNFWYIGGSYGTDTSNFGKVTPGGVRTTYTLPFDAVALAAGPDGNIWISGTDAIVMVVP